MAEEEEASEEPFESQQASDEVQDLLEPDEEQVPLKVEVVPEVKESIKSEPEPLVEQIQEGKHRGLYSFTFIDAPCVV